MHDAARRAREANQAADEAAHTAAAAFAEIPTPRFSPQRIPLTALDLGIETVGQLARAAGLAAAAGTTGTAPYNRLVGPLTAVGRAGPAAALVGLANTAAQEFGEETTNPRLTPAQHDARALVDTAARGVVTTAAGTGVFALAVALGASGPIGLGIAVAAGIGAAVSADQAIDPVLDSDDALDVHGGGSAGVVHSGIITDERSTALGMPTDQLFPNNATEPAVANASPEPVSYVMPPGPPPEPPVRLDPRDEEPAPPALLPPSHLPTEPETPVH